MIEKTLEDGTRITLDTGYGYAYDVGRLNALIAETATLQAAADVLAELGIDADDVDAADELKRQLELQREQIYFAKEAFEKLRKKLKPHMRIGMRKDAHYKFCAELKNVLDESGFEG